MIAGDEVTDQCHPRMIRGIAGDGKEKKKRLQSHRWEISRQWLRLFRPCVSLEKFTAVDFRSCSKRTSLVIGQIQLHGTSMSPSCFMGSPPSPSDIPKFFSMSQNYTTVTKR
jgi:hypothetical protein